jgi:hypothetical protein
MTADELPELNTPPRRVEYACGLTSKTRKGFCEDHGLSYDTLLSITGQRLKLSYKIARRLCNGLNAENIACTPEWLLHGIGDIPYIMPVFQIGRGSQFNNSLPAGGIEDEANYFIQKHKDHIVDLIRDDAMLPLYHAGDYVGGQRFYGEDIQGCYGYNCILELEDKTTLVRHLGRATKATQYVLSALNLHSNVVQPHILTSKLISAAPIIWHRRPAVKLYEHTIKRP